MRARMIIKTGLDTRSNPVLCGIQGECWQSNLVRRFVVQKLVEKETTVKEHQTEGGE